MPIITKKSRL